MIRVSTFLFGFGFGLYDLALCTFEHYRRIAATGLAAEFEQCRPDKQVMNSYGSVKQLKHVTVMSLSIR